jgi:hypothetical protein
VLARRGRRVGWERMISRAYGLSEMKITPDDGAAGRVVKAVVRPREQ